MNSTPISSYDRPYLYPKQLSAIFSKSRWNLCEASTKSGKTVGAIVRIIEAGLSARAGQNFWWVAPIGDQARIAFNRVKQNLTPGTFDPRETPVPTITLLTGAVISFKSADNPDSLYGEDVFGVVFDEASRAKPEAWTAVRSTLTATRGWGVLIGNVKGRRNWFYEFCRRVESGKEPNGHYERITWRDAVAAGVLDVEEIEDARRNLPEREFHELYDAEASDDGGNPFGLLYIAECVRPLSERPAAAFGIDLAKKQDYLVVIGLDDHGDVCAFHRWRGIPWRESIRRIHAIVGEDVPALVDSTGVGDPVLEELQVGHGNFSGLTFSTQAKQRIMEGLAVSIQGNEIGFPAGPIVQELETFEYVFTRTATLYAAPYGYNDDCVCSLALARQQLTERQPGENFIQYMRESLANEKTRQLEPVPEVAPNNRPWRPEVIAPPKVDLDNELTELYNKTFASLTTSISVVCAGCGKKITDASKVSDGEFTWHRGCALLPPRHWPAEDELENIGAGFA